MAVIAVNTRLLLKDKLEGIGVYTYEILKRVVSLNPQHQFVFLFDRKFSNEFLFSGNVKGVVIPPQARHPWLWYAWFEWSIPFALKKYKANLFFSPDGYLSLKTHIPQVNVIHDLNFEHYPEFVPSNVYRYYHKFFPEFAKKASHILTVSDFSKKDIHERYGIPGNKITVSYNAASEIFKPLPEEKAAMVRAKYTSGHPYFVYVGALHKRKNITNLLKAFEEFKTKHYQPVKLLIVGNKMFDDREMETVYQQMKFKSDVVFTGRLNHEELAHTMAASVALLYVSFFEGFGIPVIEAMNAGVPVIAGNVTSIPEVAGDAALIVNPHNVSEIADAMLSLSTDEKLRNTLVEKGNEQKKLFLWEDSALKVSAVLNAVLEKK